MQRVCQPGSIGGIEYEKHTRPRSRLSHSTRRRRRRRALPRVPLPRLLPPPTTALRTQDRPLQTRCWSSRSVGCKSEPVKQAVKIVKSERNKRRTNNLLRILPSWCWLTLAASSTRLSPRSTAHPSLMRKYSYRLSASIISPHLGDLSGPRCYTQGSLLRPARV